MRRLIPAAVVGLLVATALRDGNFFRPNSPDLTAQELIDRNPIPGDPIPQDPGRQKERAREMIAWSQRTIADAYDAVGEKDPRWDTQAREALGLAVPFFGLAADPTPTAEEVFDLTRKAVDAGCDDPFILYLYARTSLGTRYPGPEEQERRFTAAAAAMERSAYPPFRRAVALIRAASLKAAHEGDAGARKEAGRMFDAALALIPESYDKDQLGTDGKRSWYQSCLSVIEGRKLMTGDLKAAYDRVDAALAKAPAARVLRLQVRGKFLTDYAWVARGNGYASTVTEEGGRLFAARLDDARKALNEAWEMEPDSQTAALMLIVELGIGGDRGQMETWFKRAMEADGSNRFACEAKMNWLEPKWYGSVEDMLAFGRACRETKNWRAGIPLLGAHAHLRASNYLLADERTKYFRSAQVWDEIRGIYTEYLEHCPGDSLARSEYAGFSYMAGRWGIAHEQFQKLGANISWSNRFPEDWIKKARDEVAAKIKSAPFHKPRDGG